MKKRMKILAAVLLLPLALCLSAGAAETDAQRERDEAALRSAVTGEAQPYLAGTDGQDVAGSFARLLRNAVPDAKSAWAKAAGSLGAAAGIVILTAAARGFSEAAGGAATDAVDMAGALGISAVLLRDFSGVLSLCRSALDGISVFSATLQPVLAAALSMGGSAVTATTLQVASMFAFDLVLRLTEGLLVPAVCVYLAVTVVDAAAGNGVLPRQAEDIFDAGADVVTLGNHAFGKQQIVPYLDEHSDILRPANLAPQSPGQGWGIFDGPQGSRLLVIDLIGRCDMKYGPDNPFLCVDRILKENEGRYDVALVEFHANATSEKLAMGYYLDGRVSAVWGTHTHVQTADERVNPKGTGYITDLGMTGPIHSVLGVRIEQSIAMFRGDLTEYFKTAPGDCAVSGAVFDIERGGKCVSVERVWKEYKVR